MALPYSQVHLNELSPFEIISLKTRNMIHLRRTNVHAAFLDHGKEKTLNKISTRSFQANIFAVCVPRWFGENRLGNSSKRAAARPWSYLSTHSTGQSEGSISSFFFLLHSPSPQYTIVQTNQRAIWGLYAARLRTLWYVQQYCCYRTTAPLRRK